MGLVLPERSGSQKHRPLPAGKLGRIGPGTDLDFARLGADFRDLFRGGGGAERGRYTGRFVCRLSLFPHRGLPGSESGAHPDRKSTRLNSSHVRISYAVFCLKKKKKKKKSTNI